MQEIKIYKLEDLSEIINICHFLQIGDRFIFNHFLELSKILILKAN